MHPLDGPRLKIQRAGNQNRDLARDERAYWEGHYFRVVPAETDAETGEQLYRVLIEVYPSLDWGICIGEVAHNLRSALDGLTWQLALLNSDRPGGKTQFPIFAEGNTMPAPDAELSAGRPNSSPRLPRSGLNMIKGLSAEHQARIEALQPYKPNNEGHKSPLHQLHEINNADKHRLLQVTVARLGVVITDVLSEHDPGLGGAEMRWDVGAIFEDGAVIGRGPATRSPLNPKVTPSVSFGEGCPAVYRRRVTLVLEEIREHVSGIVESFASEFPEPRPT